MTKRSSEEIKKLTSRVKNMEDWLNRHKGLLEFFMVFLTFLMVIATFFQGYISSQQVKESRRAIDYIFLSRSESASVWFYDFTYSFDESALAGNFKKASLGFDKENRPLVLYKITRDPSPAAQDDKGGISK